MAKDPAQRPATAADFLDALEDALDGEAAAAPGRRPPSPRPSRRRRRARRPARSASRRPDARRRWPGLAALAALALVAGAAIAIAAGTGGKGGGGAGTAKHAERRGAAAPSKPKSKPKTDAGPGDDPGAGPDHARRRPRRTQPDADHASRRRRAGQGRRPGRPQQPGLRAHRPGQAADAVAPLQRSVEAFRAQGRKGDIGYAYALYNLGNALRLSGHPAEAIPYLQERLQVSNYKRGIVQKELKTAQQQAGQ